MAYFVASKKSDYYGSPAFHGVIAFVQKFNQLCRMKEQNEKLWLSIDDITDINKATHVLEEMNALIEKAEQNS